MPSIDGTIPVLPRPAWLVLAIDLLSAVGSGMTLPFLVVYLHTVHGLSLATAGAAAATIALAGLVGNPVGGLLTDRMGPRSALAAGYATAALGALLLAGVQSPWQAFAGTALSGLGVAVAWPGQDALLARVVPASAHTSAFGLRYATMNAGLAVGALAAATVVDGAGSFRILYILDASSFLLAAPLLALVRPGEPDPTSPATGRPRARSRGFRALLADRLFLRLWLLTAILVGCGYAQFNTTLPVIATGAAGLAPSALSLAYAANTIAVVAVQLPALRLLRGRRRTTGIAAAATMWALTWTVVLVVSHARGPLALTSTVLAAVLFAVGETLLSPTVPAIVNDLAPEALRGRYNAGSALAYTAGFAAGPAIGGLVLESGHSTELLLGSVLVCTLAAWGALRLARRLPAHTDGIGSAPPSDGFPPGPGPASDADSEPAR